MVDRPFPDSEYETRVNKVKKLMAQVGMDAVFLTTGPNLTYLSGNPCLGPSGSRPFIFILPLEGDPVLIVQNGRQFEARAYSWVSDIRTYAELSRAPLPQIRQSFADLKLTKGCVGAELGFEQCMDIPFADFVQLQKDFPEIKFVDVGPVLWGPRMRKSEAEISYIRKACRITSQAYAECFTQLKEGMTEVEAIHTLYTITMQLGGSTPWGVITSGKGNYDFASKGPSSRKIEKGDVVWMDSACSVGGYWSDFSRAGVVGGPTEEQRRAQALIHEITMVGVEMVRPGVKASDVARACNVELAKLDLPVTSCISGLASRIGHGVGLAITELPHIAEYDDTVLEPGMVITIEPGVATPYGMFHIEEDVLVTEEGHELLSTAPRELWTIKD